MTRVSLLQPVYLGVLDSRPGGEALVAARTHGGDIAKIVPVQHRVAEQVGDGLEPAVVLG
jgi:hypothetical protein